MRIRIGTRDGLQRTVSRKFRVVQKAKNFLNSRETISFPRHIFLFFPGVSTHCGCIFTARQRALASSFSGFLDQTQRRATIGRTTLEDWSVRRRDLYLTTHNTHNKHPCTGWDSNPRSQQASGRTPTPQTARLLGPAHCVYSSVLLKSLGLLVN